MHEKCLPKNKCVKVEKRHFRLCCTNVNNRHLIRVGGGVGKPFSDNGHFTRLRSLSLTLERGGLLMMQVEGGRSHTRS